MEGDFYVRFQAGRNVRLGWRDRIGRWRAGNRRCKFLPALYASRHARRGTHNFLASFIISFLLVPLFLHRPPASKLLTASRSNLYLSMSALRSIDRLQIRSHPFALLCHDVCLLVVKNVGVQSFRFSELHWATKICRESNFFLSLQCNLWRY